MEKNLPEALAYQVERMDDVIEAYESLRNMPNIHPITFVVTLPSNKDAKKRGLDALESQDAVEMVKAYAELQDKQ